MEDKKNITKAIIEVMKTVRGIEKDSTIGSGSYSYRGVGDQQVKQVIGKAMRENGLALVPTFIEEETQLSEWDETSTYQGNNQTKHKQSVFTKVKTKYLLLHESGESIEIAGYGHGVDNQDKGAGKATTYALKYALLYTFLVPTGDIDDSDSIHSSDSTIPPKDSAKITGVCPECHAPSGKPHASNCSRK